MGGIAHPRVGGEQLAGYMSRIPSHAGSSPRGRGTDFLRNYRVPGRSVHPRVGGEQMRGASQYDQGNGSSPRGRGTVSCSPRLERGWAGSSPRGRGTVPLRTAEVEVAGSSPRGRGTGMSSANLNTRSARFIPAWAGNSLSVQSALSRHPRIDGSSPRGRGTAWLGIRDITASRFIPAWAGNRAKIVRLGVRGRFIPAWAGNRARGFTPWPNYTVHPRVGGEQISSKLSSTWPFGSSPRGRGTDCWTGSANSWTRFIPAWAGNRAGGPGISPASPVHPRVGGEQVLLSLEQVSTVHPRVGGEQLHRGSEEVESAGSSPRGRGTVRDCSSWDSILPVHPRVGGEQQDQDQDKYRQSGSSPRGRGTAHQVVLALSIHRFIPAWAGNRC